MENSSISNKSVYISTRFSSLWPIDKSLSGATATGLSGPGNDGKEGVLYIPQSSLMKNRQYSYKVISAKYLFLQIDYRSRG